MLVETIKHAAQAVGLYDTPIYGRDEIKPDYYDLFNWSPDCSQKTFFGTLNETLFNTLDRKMAYLQGVLEDGINKSLLKDGKIQFANSNDKVERVKRWMSEVDYWCKFGNPFGTKNQFRITMGGVLSHYTQYGYPTIHTLTLDKKVVNYIQQHIFTKDDI